MEEEDKEMTEEERRKRLREKEDRGSETEMSTWSIEGGIEFYFVGPKRTLI